MKMPLFGRRASGVVGAVFVLLLTSPAVDADLGDLVEALEDAFKADGLAINSTTG